MLFNLQDQHQEEEETKKMDGPVAPACYGCIHMTASPLECHHPNSIKVLWDPMRNRCYRIPSIKLCREYGGLCKFYEPSKEKGAEYAIQQEQDGKKKPETFDSITNRIINDGNVEEFMEVLASKLREEDDND